MASALTFLPETPNDLMMLVVTLDETGHEEESLQMLRHGRKRFPGSGELRLMESVSKLELGDTRAARKLADGAAAEVTDIVQELHDAASKVEAIQRRMAEFERLRDAEPLPEAEQAALDDILSRIAELREKRGDQLPSPEEMEEIGRRVDKLHARLRKRRDRR